VHNLILMAVFRSTGWSLVLLSWPGKRTQFDIATCKHGELKVIYLLGMCIQMLLGCVKSWLHWSI